MKISSDNPEHVGKYQIVDCMGRPIRYVQSFDTETCMAEIVLAQTNHDGTHSVVFVVDDGGVTRPAVACVKLGGAQAVRIIPICGSPVDVVGA